ncbi:MAG: DUF1702 family protein [Hyphomicrobiales bacterium]|nr:DUF1702 family protein [Hyphomicrobiales bacterium]
MISWTLKTAVRYFLRHVSFPHVRGDEAMPTIQGVLDAFEAGFIAALDGTGETVERTLARFPWFRHEFVHEGVATALAGKHCLSLARGNPDYRRLGNHYRRMYYTGYGFWNGLARIYPVPALSLDCRQWSNVSDFAELGPLIPGGMGFVVVGAMAKFDREVRSKLAVPSHPGWESAALHGCGRAIWFLCMHNAAKIAEIVDDHPDIRDHLLAGVGIAIGFTQIYRPENIMRAVDSFGPIHRDMVMRGAAVALANMPLDNPAILPRVEAAARGPLWPVYQRILVAMKAASPGERWYESFVEQVKRLPTEQPALMSESI